MLLVMVSWLLAMVAGLMWARPYTMALTAATLAAFVVAQGSALAGWTGWTQLLALGVTPWLLGAQREREEGVLSQLQAEEAERMAHLGDSARGLLSLQHSIQQMETQITEISDLYHVTKETVRALHVDELFAASLTIAPRLLDVQGLRLIDLSGDTPRVLRARRAADGTMVAASNGEPTGPADAVAHPIEAEEAIIREVKTRAQPAGTTAAKLADSLPEGVLRMSWAPLWRDQQPVGILVADELPDEQLKMLAIVANQLALQFSRVSLYQEVERLSVTDALTGLSVRNHFMGRAREELARSIRHGLSCTLLMIDLDLFKQKNDLYGHLVGDVVLRDVARLLQRNLREIDMIARYGGEEFILLLIETNVEQAMPIAQRLQQLVEVHPIRAYDELLSQTISGGVAGFPEHAKTLEALIERADEALYAAKRAGRNRVVAWSERLRSEDSRTM